MVYIVNKLYMYHIKRGEMKFMLNKFISKTTEENTKKNLKKLAGYIVYAKGYRTINNFAADCKIGGDYMEDLIKANISIYPTLPTLKIIAENSDGRVSLKELMLACGYSNYENNDLQQIKNIRIERGAIYYANFSGRGIDSEVSDRRPVLVIQNFKGNAFSTNTKVLSITSRCKPKLVTHVPIGKEHGLRYDSIICCELEDTISKRRLMSKSGVVEKIAECSEELMLKVAIACAKADGYIDLDVPEEYAIKMLTEINNRKTRTFRYDNNYNMGRQVAYGF